MALSTIKRLECFLAWHPKSHTLRVWLPSLCSQPTLILGNLFQLPTLLGFALQSFLPLPWSTSPFRKSLSALALSHKTSGHTLASPKTLYRRSNGLIPQEKLYSLLRPNGLGWVGAYCSLGLCDLLGLLQTHTHEKSIYLLPCPSRTSKLAPLRKPTPCTSGRSDMRSADSPKSALSNHFPGSCLHGLFHHHLLQPLGRIGSPRTIFSSQGQKLLTKSQKPIFAENHPSPNGRLDNLTAALTAFSDRKSVV